MFLSTMRRVPTLIRLFRMLSVWIRWTFPIFIFIVLRIQHAAHASQIPGAQPPLVCLFYFYWCVASRRNCTLQKRARQWGPYTSKYMLLLAHWRRSQAPNLSQNAFDSLLKLLNRIVQEEDFDPNAMPASFYEIDECEHELDIIVWCLLRFL